MAVVDPFTLLSELVTLGPKASAIAKKARGKYAAEERAEVRALLRLIDERRVFHVPMTIEVVECCTGSLETFKTEVERVLTRVQHPVAEAAVGTMRDAVRAFLDAWRAFRTPPGYLSGGGFPGRAFPEPSSRDEESIARFFFELGALRQDIRGMVEVLRIVDPKLESPKILAGRAVP